MKKRVEHYNMVDGGRTVLRTAMLTLIESIRHPRSTSVISEELPFFGRSFEALETKTDSHPLGHGSGPLRGKPAATVPPIFKLVLLSVLALTVISGICHVVLSIALSNPTDLQKSAFETMGTTWKMGFGAIVGLLGGKSIR